jgi:hypothetical protein
MREFFTCENYFDKFEIRDIPYEKQKRENCKISHQKRGKINGFHSMQLWQE